jgi:hypothetical protein
MISISPENKPVLVVFSGLCVAAAIAGSIYAAWPNRQASPSAEASIQNPPAQVSMATPTKMLPKDIWADAPLDTLHRDQMEAWWKAAHPSKTRTRPKPPPKHNPTKTQLAEQSWGSSATPPHPSIIDTPRYLTDTSRWPINRHPSP